jgi:hypothetical protein
VVDEGAGDEVLQLQGSEGGIRPWLRTLVDDEKHDRASSPSRVDGRCVMRR